MKREKSLGTALLEAARPRTLPASLSPVVSVDSGSAVCGRSPVGTDSQ